MRARYDDGGPDLPEHPCDVCGRDCGLCVCPECPDCGAHGDPKCWEEHALKGTPKPVKLEPEVYEEPDYPDYVEPDEPY